jgi:hypothetical protein
MEFTAQLAFIPEAPSRSRRHKAVGDPGTPDLLLLLLLLLLGWDRAALAAAPELSAPKQAVAELKVLDEGSPGCSCEWARVRPARSTKQQQQQRRVLASAPPAVPTDPATNPTVSRLSRIPSALQARERRVVVEGRREPLGFASKQRPPHPTPNQRNPLPTPPPMVGWCGVASGVAGAVLLSVTAGV